MAKIESYFNCDLKKAVQVQVLSGNVFSMDNNGNRICVRIFNDGEKATVTGSVSGRCILADGSTVNVSGGLTTANGQSVAYVDIPQGCLLIPGTLKITVQLTDSGEITTLAAILTTVYQTKTDNVITPSQQIINDWNAAISSALGAQDAQISALSTALTAEANARQAADTAEATARQNADNDLKSALKVVNKEFEAEQLGQPVVIDLNASMMTYLNKYYNNGQMNTAGGHACMEIHDKSLSNIKIPISTTATAQIPVIAVLKNGTEVISKVISTTAITEVNLVNVDYDTIYINWWNGLVSPYFDTITIERKYSFSDFANVNEVIENELPTIELKTSVIADYSDKCTNEGYINSGGGIHNVSGTGWHYSDAIQLPESAKKKVLTVCVRGYAQKQTNVATLVVGFYQGSRYIGGVFPTEITGEAGELIETIINIPQNATHMRLCSDRYPNTGDFFKAVIIASPTESIKMDIADTLYDNVAKNCMQYISNQNGYLDPSGNFHSAVDSGWSASDYIDVENYNTVKYVLRGANNTSVIALYNPDKTFITSVVPTGPGEVSVSGEMNISFASYMRICFASGPANYKDLMCTLLNVDRTNNDPIYHIVNKPYIFSGKNAVFCGDSITRGFTSGQTITENGYPKLFSDAVGMTFENKGVGGASIARVTGYSCIQDQVTSISNLGGVDFIFIAGGVNDWQLGASLSDFRTAVGTICDYLTTQAYSGEVVFILPINEAGWKPESTPVAELDDYRRIIKEVAMQYEYAIVNGALFNFPVKGSNSAYISALFGDKLHPSEKGYRIYAMGLKTALCN